MDIICLLTKYKEASLVPESSVKFPDLMSGDRQKSIENVHILVFSLLVV